MNVYIIIFKKYNILEFEKTAPNGNPNPLGRYDGEVITISCKV